MHGRGTFYSTNDELPGTLRYWIANKWDMTTNEIWDFRMHVYGGTGSFSGVRGSVEADGPDFLMGLTRNPWEYSLSFFIMSTLLETLVAETRYKILYSSCAS